MAKKRKFSAYRNLSGPAYTRTSRYRAKSFIRMNKNTRIVRWHMGNQKGDFEYRICVVSKGNLQVRDLAIESFRMAANRILEKGLTKEGYYFHIKLYPHHILRENALAAGAGADRLSTGMSHAFGKTVGLASRIRAGQELVEIWVNKNGYNLAKKAANVIRTKLPGSYSVVTEKVNKEDLVKNNPSEPTVQKEEPEQSSDDLNKSEDKSVASEVEQPIAK